MTLTSHTDIDERRRSLLVRDNTGPGTDYVVTLNGIMMIRGLPDAIRFRIRYVPDKFTLDPASLDDYAAEIRKQEWSSFEEASLALFEDFNNEIVPRWLEILAETTRLGSVRGAAAENQYSALFSDCQPDWRNPRLLDRLGP